MKAVNVSRIDRCSRSYVVLTPSSSYIINSVVACVVNAIFAVAGTFLNSLVLFSFWKSKQLRNKITNFLIMVLSLTDLGVGLTGHPLYLVNAVSEIRGVPNCLYKIAYLTSLQVFVGLSGFSLLTLNIERYLSIVHPVFHRNQVTKPRCVAVLIALGFFDVMVAVCLIFDSHIRVLVIAMVFVMCLGTFSVYISIFYTARKVLLPGAQTHVRAKELQINSVEDRMNTGTFLRDLKMAKICLLVVFCCFICYLPAGVVLGMKTAKSVSLDKLTLVEVWASTLLSINSTLNCLIFFWTKREFRMEWKKAMNLKRPSLHSAFL